jgi:dGTPase
VGLADRVAYCAHDLEDAVHAGLVRGSDLPAEVAERCGIRRSEQLRAFVTDIATTTCDAGLVGLSPPMAEALAALRRFDHERIYLRAESVAQAEAVIAMLRALVDHYGAHPGDLPRQVRQEGDPLSAAVGYVSGMTDRFACTQAVALLGWPEERLPRGQDVG